MKIEKNENEVHEMDGYCTISEISKISSLIDI